MLVQKIKNKNNKNMLTFETLTLAPIDINLINYNLLTTEEIFWLNNYHNKVYEKISNNLDREERSWLKKACSPYLK
jgi:Xaa-Pro aminopeptidase